MCQEKLHYQTELHQKISELIGSVDQLSDPKLVSINEHYSMLFSKVSSTPNYDLVKLAIEQCGLVFFVRLYSVGCFAYAVEIQNDETVIAKSLCSDNSFDWSMHSEINDCLCELLIDPYTGKDKTEDLALVVNGGAVECLA